MAHQKPSELIFQVKGGTGTASLAPPWSRGQVKWLGRGYFVLRLATDETSRWFLGGGFRWADVFPHEKTFKRSAADKSVLMASLKMNPWPVHIACNSDPTQWRAMLSAAVAGKPPVYDTGYVTLWRTQELPGGLFGTSQFVVLDGHHSRRAQHHLGLSRMFGWVEPLESEHLHVRSIDRAGLLARWLEACVKAGEVKEIAQPPGVEEWVDNRSMAFEVVQGDRRWWAEVTRPISPNSSSDESVIDALTRLAKGKVFLKSSANFDEIKGWLERLEVDSGLRLPPPSKVYVRERALARKLFPQKATYFYPKVPFGLLVEDLK